MSDLADIFPGFASRWIDTGIGRILARSHGEGPAAVTFAPRAGGKASKGGHFIAKENAVDTLAALTTFPGT